MYVLQKENKCRYRYYTYVYKYIYIYIYIKYIYIYIFLCMSYMSYTGDELILHVPPRCGDVGARASKRSRC